MQSDPQKNRVIRQTKTIRLPIFNPKINAGASISESTMDELSFIVGLRTGD